MLKNTCLNLGLRYCSVLFSCASVLSLAPAGAQEQRSVGADAVPAATASLAVPESMTEIDKAAKSASLLGRSEPDAPANTVTSTVKPGLSAGVQESVQAQPEPEAARAAETSSPTVAEEPAQSRTAQSQTVAPQTAQNQTAQTETAQTQTAQIQTAEASPTPPGAPALTPPERAFLPVALPNDRATMSQLTSVSELADVQPTDWAYQALQSLVERYGCIIGYPDGTYQGQRALTRFEFAAGLNACLIRIDELLAASTADLVTKEELATRDRLRAEFANELALLRGRMDGLEARVAELEVNQFSTTMSLSGSAILAASNAFGDGLDNQVVAQYRYRLLLNGSFTGEDNLLLGLYAGNAVGDGFDTAGFDLPGLEVSDADGTRSELISTQEGGLTSTIAATTDNDLFFLAGAYSFPVGDQLLVNVAVGRTPYYFFTPILNGLYTSDEGTGAIGTFARLDPGYLLVSGGTGLVFNFDITDSLQLTAGYLADGGSVGDSAAGSGLFNGGYGVLGQLTWDITDSFSVAGMYVHDYARGGRFGFNNNGLGSTGTAIANTLAGQDLRGGDEFGIAQEPVVTNGYSAQFSWDITPELILSGWFGTYYTRLIERGDGHILTYALTFAVRDLGQDGSLLGLAVGAEPYLTRMGGDPVDFDVDVPLHIEVFYRYQINDNISITPGVIWLTAPNQSEDNPDAVIATLRTTFEF